ncbi:MAG: DUF1648 domain-containing protein [Clostridia bacterium]|nr:DUF1648 domain-containing protein [Clostridia bacterium]
MDNTQHRDVVIQIGIGVLSAVLLVLLAIRYPALPERVPVQFSTGGEVSRTVAKTVFAPVFAAAVIAYNGYIALLRRQKRAVPIMLAVVFVLVGGVATAMSLFA